MFNNAHKAVRKSPILAAAVASVAIPSLAHAGLSYTGTALTQNFDGLHSTGSFALGSSVIGVQQAIPGLTDWDVAKISGSGATPPNFVANDGTLNSGALYSYGATGSGERALGLLASGSNVMAVGVAITNNGAAALSSFTLDFTAEQWRSSTVAQNFLAFAYGVSGGGIDSSNYLTNASMTLGPTLDAPGQAPVGTNGATDGNSVFTHVHATISINVPVGATLFIRWNDTNDGGNDAGIGIDDFSFTAATGGKTLTWNPPGNSWNTSGANTNWLDGVTPSAFSDGDVVNFTDAGLASGSTVNVDAGGVNPGNINVSNTTGTYTFTGGNVAGTGVLTKTNDGTLVINNTMAAGGGLVINGGVVVAGSDAALGASGIALTMGGGTFLPSGNLTAARGLALTASTNNTINTGANTVTFTGNVSGTGTLNKQGSGTLIFNGSVLGGGYTTISGGTLVYGQASGTVNVRTNFDGGGFNGDVVVAGATRVNLNDGNFDGAGKFHIKTTGAAISNTGAGTTIINKQIALNVDNVAGPFETTIGGVGGHYTEFNQTISGNSDVSWASGTTGGGAGTLILNTAMTYTGKTLINNGGQTPATVDNTDPQNPVITATGFPAGTIRLGVDNALPATSDMIANTILAPVAPHNGPGRIDLNGHTQTFASMSSGAGVGTGLFEITNENGNGTIVVDGSVSPGAALNGIITDGRLGNGVTALVKSGSNQLEVSGVYPATYLHANDITANGGTFIPVRPYTGGTTVNGGTLILGNYTHGTLTITGGTAKVSEKGTSNSAAGTSKVPVLAISGGTLDLTNNSFVIDYTGGPNPALVTQVRQQLDAGTITTSSTAVVGATLGYADNAALGTAFTTFGGITVDTDSLLLKYTYAGDSNLDGQVDITDLAALATAWQTAGVWVNGDFDYSGFIDITDLAALATNWQAGVGAPLAMTFEQALASVGLGGQIVPEPATLTLLGLGALALRRRRA